MSVRELSPDLAELAKRTINEDPTRIKSDIEAIKNWLQKQPHLNARLDDQWILSFLRGSKFSIERTKEKLENYYTFKSMIPEFFADRDPLRPELQAIIQLGMPAFLPKPDKLGRQIICIRISLVDPKTMSILDNMKVNFMNLDVAIADSDRSVVAGDVAIIDFKGVTLEHMTQVTPSILKKIITVYQDAYPQRPQALHYINTNSFVQTTINLLKSFMKKKLQDRLFVYGSDYTKLYDHVPKELLPKEYGGHLDSIQVYSDEWKKKMESYGPWFREDGQYGCDETLRVGKPKTTSDIFGIEGSFRSLAVD